MNEYMVIIRFLSAFTEEFVSFIPAQRAEVSRLMEKGILTGYSLSMDRSTMWMTMLATSEEAVEKTMRMMPMFKFMEFSTVELMFHNSAVYTPMRFSMN
jgi:hypothetical protein